MGIKLRLLQSNDDAYYLDCIDELYRTIENDSSFSEVSRKLVLFSRVKSFLIRKMIHFPFLYKLKLGSRRNAIINFASMISGDFRLLMPYAFSSRLNFIYMYDVWPRFHKWIFPLLDFFNVRYVFFSSKQVFETFTSKYSRIKCKAVWLPEALKADDYCSKVLKERTIDVLEFGRMYDTYHNQITGPLKTAGLNHIYRTAEMPFLFPDKASFTNALASAKIVICVPSNITHPNRAEYISSMTLRYLQAMASKCLVVGILPSDMFEVFGYNPIVEIDENRPAEQLLDILNQYESYESLIEKNYKEVLKKHQWLNRWDIIKAKMLEEI
ncbi:glycosyltransferase [Pedobacter sp. AW1-32]|uniref:glycosyltransferase n=1 Tax=Pedobacter sp. AW1-32 TaxID=3383026 RepID=UPI003FEDBA2D